MGRLAFRVWLFGALALLVGWPLLATVLEASHAPWRLGRALRSSGLHQPADWLLQTWGADPEPAVGGALDPAATTRLLSESGGMARPLRLAIETLNLVFWVLALVLPPASVMALLLFRTDLWGRRFVMALLAAALFVPLPLHATCWLGALGNVGRSQAIGTVPILVGRAGAAIVHALAGFPWAVLLIGVGLRTIEPELEESALLDMPVNRIWISVTLRRGVGAIAASALALAVLTAGEMTVTDLLQIRTYAEEAYTQYSLGRGPADAAVVSLPPLLVLALSIFLATRWLERADPARLAAAFGHSRRWSLGQLRIPAGLLTLAAVTGLVAVPLYGLLWRAGRVGGRATLGKPPTWSLAGLTGTLRYAADESAGPIVVSLLLGAGAATLVVAMAWSLAWEARSSGRIRVLMFGTIALTLAVPGPVAGMALKLGYRWFPWVHDTSAIVVMGEAARILPYASVIAWLAIAILPRELLESAALDGYGPSGQAAKVLLPLTWGPMVAAWFVSFVISFGELPASNLLLPPGLTTISFQLWSLLHTGVESHLAGVALVTLAVTGVLVTGMLGSCLLVSRVFARR